MTALATRLEAEFSRLRIVHQAMLFPCQGRAPAPAAAFGNG